MATETSHSHDVESRFETGHLAAGGVVGFLAGALFGGGVMNPAELMPLIATLYGLEGTVAGGLVAGWIAHLIHSVVFGVAFVALVAATPARAYADRPSGGAVVGLAFGLLVWLVAAAVVMPAWIGAVTGASPPVPNVNWVSFVGHAVYGATLGVLYPLVVAHEV